jgi:hypothetical protein
MAKAKAAAKGAKGPKPTAKAELKVKQAAVKKETKKKVRVARRLGCPGGTGPQRGRGRPSLLLLLLAPCWMTARPSHVPPACLRALRRP